MTTPTNQLARLGAAALLGLALWTGLATPAQAQNQTQTPTRPMRTEVGGAGPVKSLLWVGNSFFYYNNSMHGHVGNLARAAEPRVALRGVSVTISGSGLDWHDVESYFRPDGIGRYSFVGDNEIVFNPPGRQFDAVIMMDCSQCPIHPQLKSVFTEQVKKHSTTVVRHGARPVLFMSWAYKDKPEMSATLAEAYTLAGNANDALVIPAGLAFARAIAARPALELYQPDKRHPSLAGTYLAACTVLAAVTGRSPVGNSYTAGLDGELAAFLQATAWQTVQAYHGK
ncbi:MAG: hypothetical protein RLZZ584_129 [Pseudomonadota bacterium]|jgi:hypothetical protein